MKLFVLTSVMMALSLSGCSKNIFLADNEGPDAYVIRTYDPLKEPQAGIRQLPEPVEERVSVPIPTKTKSAASILGLGGKQELSQSQAYKEVIAKTGASQTPMDFETFDREMEKNYAKERKEKGTALDYILGKEPQTVDPVMETEEE